MSTHLLIYPPFADPTQPYVGLPTLKGHLRRHGLDARVIDANLDATHWLLRPETAVDLAAELGRQFRDLDRRPSLDYRQQTHYLRLARAIEQLHACPEPTAPAAVLQDPIAFYDRDAYRAARDRVEAVFAALSAVNFPLRFDFNRAGPELVPWSFDALQRYCADERSPLDALYHRLFDGTAAELEFAGVTIVFPSQIPEAFYLCRLLRRLAPTAFIAIGGPCLHQTIVHMDDAKRLRLLEMVDGIGLYDGEETVATLFRLLPEWRTATAAERPAILARVPNLLTADPVAGQTRRGPQYLHNLTDTAVPDFSDIDLDRYLAPTRMLAYAPTRGCYWDKCSFCYYGLSDTATARYREIPPARAAADLAHLANTHGADHVYLSCDVLSPAYAVRLAQAIVDAGLEIHWSSDLKIEAYYTDERCALLAKSGLVAGAFGIESGSDRILKLMRKGCDKQTATEVNRAFHRAGVACQWMTFADHPGESLSEALATVSWIQEETAAVDLFIVGSFGLEAGSDIAGRPAHYGVERIYYAVGDDFGLHALFDQETERTPREGEAVDQAVDRLASRYRLDHYPWAGSIGTHHTFLYFLHFGQRAFQRSKQDRAATRPRRAPAPTLGATRYPLADLAAAEGEFLADYLPLALSAVATSTGAQAPLSAAHLARAQAAAPHAAPRLRAIRTGGGGRGRQRRSR